MKIIVFLGFVVALMGMFVSAPDVSGQQIKIVAFGDSITAPRKGVVVYSKVLEDEFKRKNLDIRVINSGVPGNTTAIAKERFEKDVLAHRPNVVIIQFGTNDAAVDVWKNPPETVSRVSKADYEKNLREFITAIRKLGAKVILVTPAPTRWTDKLKEMYGKPPYDPEDVDGFNVILKDYVGIAKRVAKDEGVRTVDLFSAYYKYDKRPGKKMDDLFLDGLHPNTAGQRIEAEMLLKQLRKMKLGS
ncbi:MAG TPA: GDSL-type esterase/lipase family protein [Pyrinomonadaceae bacterium]|nr:GDSL-type esterase/lipase family protein [Pyrinomonadaceae bacterium]